MSFDPVVVEAYKKALVAQDNAHAPYSNFHVGAALKVKGHDDIFVGCNVENASYGATICAERVAITSSVAKFGKTDFDFLVIVTNTDPAIGPCALCLQVLAEFCPPEFPIYLGNKSGLQSKYTFGDFLSSPFSTIPDQV